MVKFETTNELTLKITTQGQSIVFTKAGAFIGGECYGAKNYAFEKVLLGPQGNPLQAALGQLGRRFTGENLPLMRVTSRGDNITYYANFIIFWFLQFSRLLFSFGNTFDNSSYFIEKMNFFIDSFKNR